VRFLVDRCAGRRLAEWLRTQGHDVVEARELGRDPGDEALLDLAARQERIVVTLDTDFGALVYLCRWPSPSRTRPPSRCPSRGTIRLMDEILSRYSEELAAVRSWPFDVVAYASPAGATDPSSRDMSGRHWSAWDHDLEELEIGRDFGEPIARSSRHDERVAG